VKRIALALLMASVIFAGTAHAADIVGYLCHEPDGNDECNEAEGEQEIGTNLDGDDLDPAGRLIRNEDAGSRTFEAYVDFDDTGETEVCKMVAQIHADPLTVLNIVAYDTGEAGAYAWPECVRVSDKPAPAGWPGLTDRYKCAIKEVDYTVPDGDLVMGDAAELRLEVLTKPEASYGAGARTGAGAIVLVAVKQWHIVGASPPYTCENEMGLSVEKGGEITFSVEDKDILGGVGDAVYCGLDDIDGDGDCEVDPATSIGDNCGGFDGHDWTQQDTDGDGYGNVCDSDVDGDCDADAFDAAAIYSHIGDSITNDWNLASHGASGHGDVYDINGSMTVTQADVDLAEATYMDPIGPTYRSGASPVPSCP
jgi:hypothetical protein